MAEEHRVSRQALVTSGLTIPAGKPQRVTVTGGEPFFAELQEALFHHNSSAMLPSIFAASEDEDDRDRLALSLVAQSLQFLQQFPGKKFVVAGHTDTTGADQYNDKLAKSRADCAAAALTGDRELFKSAAFGPHLTSKAQRLQVQKPDHLVLLEWAYREFGWPCRPQDNFGDYVAAVREFQRSYNRDGRAGSAVAPDLTVDGDWGILTWGAVFDCYELEVARHLVIPVSQLAGLRGQIGVAGRALLPDPAVGCGEHCPIEAAGQDNFRSQANKRVEILFFDDGDAPVIDCPGNMCDLAGSQWYRNIPQDERKPLPVITWQHPFQSAWLLDQRKIVVESPALDDGEQVSFSISQLVDGQELDVLKDVAVSAQGGRAELAFDELADGAFKAAPATQTAGDAFFRSSYRAKVAVGGATFFSRPLPFQDEMHLPRYAK
jgi:hypothetical protein